MRKLILLLAAIFAFATIQAQDKESKIGIKIGFNYNAANFDLGGQAVDNLKDINSNNGWHLGINYRGYIASLFYWQPELMYSQTSLSFVDHNSKETKFHENMIDLNILMGAELFDFLRVYAGPTGSFNLGTSQEDNDIKTSFKSFRAGYQIGVGADLFSMLTFDIAYKGSFSSDNGTATVAGVDIPLDQNVSMMLISLGIMF